MYTVEVVRGSKVYTFQYRYSVLRELYQRLRKQFPKHTFPRFPERVLFGTMSCQSILPRRPWRYDLTVVVRRVASPRRALPPPPR